MTEPTRAELADRLDKFADVLSPMFSADGLVDLRAAAAALREPTIRFRWVTDEHGEDECALLTHGVYAGQVHYWTKNKSWRAYCYTCVGQHHISWHRTKADAQKVTEAHVAARVGGTVPLDLLPLVQMLVEDYRKLLTLTKFELEGTGNETRQPWKRRIEHGEAVLTSAAEAGFKVGDPVVGCGCDAD